MPPQLPARFDIWLGTKCEYSISKTQSSTKNVEVRVGSHGVPSPTYGSKYQDGGKVPTSEPQDTTTI